MRTENHYLDYALRPQNSDAYPLDWQTAFDGDAPLAVEIGFGNGEFLVDWATRQPGWHFVGLELSIESMERLLRRIQKHRLTNIRPILEDARFAVGEFFADNSLTHVMMNFPDPWPKDRHQDRRLLDEPFIETLGAVLKKKHYYELVSDQKWYAEHTYSLFQDAPYFDDVEFTENPVREIATKYEKKWQEMGRSSYRVLARKCKTPAIVRRLEDEAMPHAFVETVVDEKSIKELIGFKKSEADLFFVVKDTYGDINSAKYLLHVIAKDGAHKQNFHVVINQQKKGRWIVKLDPNTQPYRTPAVKMAVHEIGNRLANS